jgi:eukaryotic-like serine/threonine-protein kinase
MVFLAIVLGALVLLCSGVISYQLRNNLGAGAPGGASVQAVKSGALRPDGRDDLAGTAYRRLDQPRPGGDETTTSEGRQTR